MGTLPRVLPLLLVIYNPFDYRQNLLVTTAIKCSVGAREDISL